MKVIFRLIVLVTFCALQFSCKTTDTIKILGTPKTEIYTPEMKKIATINDNGAVDVEFSKFTHYSYLMSRVPGSKDYVPFAIDYFETDQKKKSLGWTLYAVGLSSIIIGGPVASSSYAAGMSMIGIGGVVAMSSIWPLCSAYAGGVQTKYNFKYPTEFKTNQSLKFVDFVDDGYIKKVESKQDKIEENNDVTSENNLKASSALKSVISLKDYGKQIEGEYIGSGKLKQDGMTIETFDGLIISIEKYTKKDVYVNVKTSDGIEFFSSKILYNIGVSENGGFVLSMEDMPSAKIQINESNDLQYNHPNVNIDGDVYTLEISAVKK